MRKDRLLARVSLILIFVGSYFVGGIVGLGICSVLFGILLLIALAEVEKERRERLSKGASSDVLEEIKRSLKVMRDEGIFQYDHSFDFETIDMFLEYIRNVEEEV